MINNAARIGNITSSEIVAMMSRDKTGKEFGKPAQTYIDECNMERKLGRSLNSEISAKPTSWGNLVEQRAFEVLGLEYKICSSETITHPMIPYWSGSPDGNKFDEGKTVFDIKCPMTLKSFCTMADCKTIDEVRMNHKDGDKFYWQLVSNAVLTESKYAELIVYCPYERELDAIRELASNYDGDQNKVAWIGFGTNDELPFVPEGGHYKNIYVIRFEVPQSDKDALTNSVIKAGAFLIDPVKFKQAA
jgi:hypothetical protein